MSDSNKDTPKTDNFFSTEHLMPDLKRHSVRGGAVTIAAQGTRFFLRTCSIAILARLLTPEDYGLIAMVTTVTGFITMFKDLGLSMATVQRDKINHEQISTLFWINVLLSVCVMLVVISLSPVIAWFYGEPKLVWITIGMSSAFLFAGLTVQHQALLRRQMRFGFLAIIQITSILIGIIIAITAALCGLRYWALVCMTVGTALANSIGVWIICPWRPGWPVRRSGVKKMITFGGYLTGSSIFNYISRNSDNIIIGKFLGSVPLGLYSRAYSLLTLPLQQITSPIAAVAIPALSRLQNEHETYRRYYYKATRTIAYITMPLIAILAALSDEIILIILGPKWIKAAIIFKFLAITAFRQPVTTTTGWIFVSLGQTKRMMYWSLIVAPVLVTSFIIGFQWGLIGVAVAYTISSLFILTIPSLLYAFKYSPINLKGFLVSVSHPALLSILIYIGLELIRNLFALEASILAALYYGLTILSIAVIFFALLPKARGEAISTLKIVRMLKR